MSATILAEITAELGDRVAASGSFRGDEWLRVATSDWLDAEQRLRDGFGFDHFIDLSAVDYPERDAEARFDVFVLLRASKSGARVRLETRIGDGTPVPTLTGLWKGADWAEREVFDMFGITFKDHPDLRRILMYDAFEGYPLRKDYPIERTQPLVAYRQEPGLAKLPPFGLEEGQPWARIDWQARLAGKDLQVSPTLAAQRGVQTGNLPTPSQPGADDATEDAPTTEPST